MDHQLGRGSPVLQNGMSLFSGNRDIPTVFGAGSRDRHHLFQHWVNGVSARFGKIVAVGFDAERLFSSHRASTGGIPPQSPSARNTVRKVSRIILRSSYNTPTADRDM